MGLFRDVGPNQPRESACFDGTILDKQLGLFVLGFGFQGLGCRISVSGFGCRIPGTQQAEHTTFDEP